MKLTDHQDGSFTLEIAKRRAIEFRVYEDGSVRVLADTAVDIRPIASNGFTMQMREDR